MIKLEKEQKQNKITVIFGRKGSGKSYYANQISRAMGPVVIFDPLNEYKGGYYFYKLADFRKWAWLMRFKRVILKFVDDDDFRAAFGIVFEIGYTTILVEETDMFANSSFIIPELAKILKYGRHKRINQIYISRRPYEINRLVTSQADKIIVFKQSEGRDIDFLERLGFNPNEIMGLKLYEHLEKEI